MIFNRGRGAGARRILPPRESLTISLDTLGCHNWWQEGDTVIVYGVEARDSEHPARYKITLTICKLPSQCGLVFQYINFGGHHSVHTSIKGKKPFMIVVIS